VALFLEIVRQKAKHSPGVAKAMAEQWGNF